MKHQDQRSIETLESQMLERSQERRADNSAPQSYRPPQVWLVGKAKRLMAGSCNGSITDLANCYRFG